MRASIGWLVILALSVVAAAAQNRQATAKGLDIYVVDVEGGNAVRVAIRRVGAD
jgi:hypothetical protein